MIDSEKIPDALDIVKRLIVAAKSRAYERGADDVAELLNDIEILPEFVGDGADRTQEFVEALQGIAQLHPECTFATRSHTTTDITSGSNQ